MTAVKTLRRGFSVGKHRAVLSVQLAAGIPTDVSVEWNRAKPPRLSNADLVRYRQLRNAILQAVANELGAAIAVVDLEPDGRMTPTVIQPETAP